MALACAPANNASHEPRAEKLPAYVPDEKDVGSLMDCDSSGLDWVFDRKSIPEMHMRVTDSEWQKLLEEYDKNSATPFQIHADLRFVRDGEEICVADGGLRLKGGAWSRRRPQKSDGTLRHVHYQVNFGKFHKDDEHSVHGCRRICFKYFKGDPSYAREILAYDLLGDAKVWTASFNTYCRMYLKIGSAPEQYLGIYDAIEHVDRQYLKARKELFAQSDGNLWKADLGAKLNNPDDDFGVDTGDGEWHLYELKTNVGEFDAAAA